MKEYKVTYAESERQQYIFLIDGDKISSISVIKRGETTKYSLNPKEGEEQLTAKFFGSVMEKMVQNKFSAFDIITLLVKEPQEYVDAYLEAFKRDIFERRKWEERHLSK